MEDDELTLENIGEGIIPEIYEKGLQKILMNIADTETSPKKARKLTIELSFEPTDETGEMDIHISSRINTAPKRGRSTKAYLMKKDGRMGLTAMNPQPDLPFKEAAGE